MVTTNKWSVCIVFYLSHDDCQFLNNSMQIEGGDIVTTIVDNCIFDQGSVELIVRSTDEFITYLNLPEESLFQGRSYTSSYIRYRRIQN